MLSRKVLLWVLLGFLAVATPVASGWLMDNTGPAIQVADIPPPPPDCGLYDICRAPGS